MEQSLSFPPGLRKPSHPTGFCGAGSTIPLGATWPTPPFLSSTCPGCDLPPPRSPFPFLPCAWSYPTQASCSCPSGPRTASAFTEGNSFSAEPWCRLREVLVPRWGGMQPCPLAAELWVGFTQSPCSCANSPLHFGVGTRLTVTGMGAPFLTGGCLVWAAGKGIGRKNKGPSPRSLPGAPCPLLPCRSLPGLFCRVCCRSPPRSSPLRLEGPVFSCAFPCSPGLFSSPLSWFVVLLPLPSFPLFIRSFVFPSRLNPLLPC